MSYGKGHMEDNCDKCETNVGIDNLEPFPFIFKDLNDESHPDQGNGYRQYYGCFKCIAKDKRIKEGIEKLREERWLKNGKH